MFSFLDVFFGYLIYVAFEIIIRGGIFVFFTGKKYISRGLVTPRISMLLSPGYWFSFNLKNACIEDLSHSDLRKKIIYNSNLFNLLFSVVALIFIFMFVYYGSNVSRLAVAFFGWRFVSRSFEILTAFVKDISTHKCNSDLNNIDRMQLALRSYVEIFIYSASFYFCIYYNCLAVEINSICPEVKTGLMWQAILSSLFVGTLTDVSGVAKSLGNYSFFVFIQVFAILSLVILSIAGYIGNVKKQGGSPKKRHYVYKKFESERWVWVRVDTK